MGSAHDPLPLGTWKIYGADYNPKFHYNPDAVLGCEARTTRRRCCRRGRTARSAWCGSTCRRSITASTARPSRETIGRTESHGCIRLTNWDAARLALMVKPGTPAVFQA